MYLVFIAHCFPRQRRVLLQILGARNTNVYLFISPKPPTSYSSSFFLHHFSRNRKPFNI